MLTTTGASPSSSSRTPVRGRLWRLGSVVTLLGTFLTVGASVVTAPPAAATHFRAAGLSWHRADSTTRQVEFHYNGSFRRSYFATSGTGPGPFAGPYPPPGPNVGQTVNIGSAITFGDGTSSGNVIATVETVDAANDVITVDAHLDHTYGGTATSFLAAFENCCRLSSPLHRNNPDRGLRTETRVSLANGVTGSPVASVSPIVDCPVNALCQFFLPATDPDGAALSWRFATSAEAAGSNGPFVQPAGATVNSATGLYRWDTTGASLNPTGDSYFSTQVIVTKTAGGGATATVAADFFLRVTDTASPDQPPVFVDPTPADGTVITTTPNGAVSFDVQATDPDAGDAVTLSVLGTPPTATFTSTPANPASGTFSWTPTTPGDTILTLTAQDPFGVGATQRSVTIHVGDNVPPVVTVPGDMTVEATGPSGAAVTFTATANDNVDGPLTPSCDVLSGATLPLGDTTVTCTATDAAGNTGTASFVVHVVDTTPPTVVAPADVTAEATSPAGADVFYPNAAAHDTVDGTVTAACAPASLSTFPLGATTVTCTATDSHHNTGSATFHVNVVDTVGPALSLPATITAEATSPAGAAVTYTATATDVVDGPITPTCSPASGATFPLGTTTVNCSATDAHSNPTGGSFTVVVRDTTAPVITWTGNQGTYSPDQTVNITCTATDSGSGIASATCPNISGPASSFNIGVNTFTATATDNAGNTTTSSTSFTVGVTPQSLCNLTRSYETKSGVADSLCVKIQNAAAAIARGDRNGAKAQLLDYQNEVSAQAGKSMTKDQAALLIKYAQMLAASW